jgi:hypothetical protein
VRAFDQPLASASLVVLACTMSLASARAANVEVINVDRSGLAIIGVSGELKTEDGKAFRTSSPSCRGAATGATTSPLYGAAIFSACRAMLSKQPNSTTGPNQGRIRKASCMDGRLGGASASQFDELPDQQDGNAQRKIPRPAQQRNPEREFRRLPE